MHMWGSEQEGVFVVWKCNYILIVMVGIGFYAGIKIHNNVHTKK